MAESWLFRVQEWHWIDSLPLWRNRVIELPERAGLGVEMDDDAGRKAQVPGTPWFEAETRG
jgi:L-alanine-DL-glutamate epimerase-like enolase superfamily enzyme